MLNEIYPDYFIEDSGILYSNKRSKMIAMKPATDSWGYLYTYIMLDGKPKFVQLHRLVATAFCEREEEHMQINHLDGDKQNNRANNLQWCTAAENARHKYTVLGIVNRGVSGEANNFGRYSDELILEGLHLIYSGVSISRAAQMVGISAEGLRRVCVGSTRTQLLQSCDDSFQQYFKDNFKQVEPKAKCYRDEDLFKAIEDICAGMSKAEASRKYNISEAVIRHVFAGRSRLDLWNKVNKDRCND